MHPAQIGDLQFRCDVKSWPDQSAVMTENLGSDVAALERLLAKKRLSLPHMTVLVRMFHLPSADRRTELMVIYGEALPQDGPVPYARRASTSTRSRPTWRGRFLDARETD